MVSTKYEDFKNKRGKEETIEIETTCYQRKFNQRITEVDVLAYKFSYKILGKKAEVEVINDFPQIILHLIYQKGSTDYNLNSHGKMASLMKLCSRFTESVKHRVVKSQVRKIAFPYSDIIQVVLDFLVTFEFFKFVNQHSLLSAAALVRELTQGIQKYEGLLLNLVCNFIIHNPGLTINLTSKFKLDLNVNKELLHKQVKIMKPKTRSSKKTRDAHPDDEHSRVSVTGRSVVDIMEFNHDIISLKVESVSKQEHRLNIEMDAREPILWMLKLSPVEMSEIKRNDNSDVKLPNFFALFFVVLCQVLIDHPDETILYATWAREKVQRIKYHNIAHRYVYGLIIHHQLGVEAHTDVNLFYPLYDLEDVKFSGVPTITDVSDMDYLSDSLFVDDDV